MKLLIYMVYVVAVLCFVVSVAFAGADDWNIGRGERERLVTLAPGGEVEAETVRRLQRWQSGSASANKFLRYKLTDHLDMGLDGVIVYGTILSDVVIRHNRLGMSGTLDVTAVLDETGSLLFAFTEKPGEWVLPVMEPRDTKVEIARAGWTISPISPDSLSSELGEVIGAIWNEIGLDPQEIGQLVIRPARIAAKAPVDSRGVPAMNGEPGWLVYATGVLMSATLIGSPDSPNYFSGFICIVDDRDITPRVYSLRCMP